MILGNRDRDYEKGELRISLRDLIWHWARDHEDAADIRFRGNGELKAEYRFDPKKGIIKR